MQVPSLTMASSVPRMIPLSVTSHIPMRTMGCGVACRGAGLISPVPLLALQRCGLGTSGARPDVRWTLTLFQDAPTTL